MEGTTRKPIIFILLLIAGTAAIIKVSSALNRGTGEELAIKKDEVRINPYKVSDRYLDCYIRDTAKLNKFCFDKCALPEVSEDLYKTKIKELETTIPLVYNESVRGYLKLYLIKKRALLTRIVGRSYEYYPVFERKLAEHNMPDELKHLSIVESALNNEAKSWCGASGVWQFMPATARIYNLRVDSVDERYDIEKSTDAALRFLKDLHSRYGDWLLAIAAYNCGPGNVNKAIRKAGGGKGIRRDFWAIKKFLPAETQGYVPAFVAACYFMNNYHAHNIRAINPEYLSMELKCVELEENVSFRTVSRYLDITPEELACFNSPYERHGKIEFKDTVPNIVLPEKLLNEWEKYECSIYDDERSMIPVTAKK